MSAKLTFKDLGLDVNSLIMDSMGKMGVMIGEKIDDLQRQIDELKAEKAK